MHVVSVNLQKQSVRECKLKAIHRKHRGSIKAIDVMMVQTKRVFILINKLKSKAIFHFYLQLFLEEIENISLFQLCYRKLRELKKS